MSRALLRKEETPSTQLTYFLSLPCDKTGRHNGSAEEGEERKNEKNTYATAAKTHRNSKRKKDALRTVRQNTSRNFPQQKPAAEVAG